MKIFFPFSGFSVGGSHISILNIIQNLDEKFEPIIIYHNKSINFDKFLKKNNLKSIYLPIKSIPGDKPFFLNILFKLFINYFKISNFIKKNQPDIIHCNDLGMNLLWSFGNILHNSNFVWHQRQIVRSNSWKYYFINFINCKIICNSTITFDSIPKFIKKEKYIIKNLFTNKKNINSITQSNNFYNFISRSKKESRTILSHMGRIEKNKNIILLIDLMDFFINQNKQKFSLVIIGKSNPNFLKKINNLVKIRNLQNYIYFQDFVIEPLNYISLSDICIYPSNVESFGRNAFESLCLGKPVIVSDGGAYSEFIKDGFNGMIFKKNNINDLVDKINLLIKNNDLRKKITEEGKRFYNNYLKYQNKELEKLINIYNKI